MIRETAVKENAIWRKRLGDKWPTAGKFVLAGIPVTALSASFVDAVYTYQLANGLDADGVLGPKTAASIRGLAWAPPPGSDSILVGGVRIPVQANVITPDEEGGLSFDVTDKGAWKRENSVSLFIIHVKGAEGSALGTWSYLRSKGYGVHLSGERDGRCWQYADLEHIATAHAGKVNDESVGMELTNQMYPVEPNRYGRPHVTGDYVARDPDSRKYGQSFERTVLGLLPAQIEMLGAVVPVACDALGIPRVLPGKGGKLYGGLLPGLRPKPGDWKKLHGTTTWSGVAGHLNVTNGHIDPSPDALYCLLDFGFKLQEVQS